MCLQDFSLSMASIVRVVTVTGEIGGYGWGIEGKRLIPMLFNQSDSLFYIV